MYRIDTFEDLPAHNRPITSAYPPPSTISRAIFALLLPKSVCFSSSSTLVYLREIPIMGIMAESE